MQDIRRPEGMPDEAWADYLQFVKQKEMDARGELPDRPGIGGTYSDYMRGVGTGLAQTATSAVKGFGGLVGSEGIHEWGDQAGKAVEDYLDPRGMAGSFGKTMGRIGGEGGLLLTGGGTALRGIQALGKGSQIARAVGAGLGRMTGSSSALVRTAGRAIPGAPIEFALGAGEAGPGESAVGAGLGRVGTGILGGYGLSRLGGWAGGRAARLASAADVPPPAPTTVAPSAGGTREIRGLLPGGASVRGPEGPNSFSMAAPGRQVELTFVEDEVDRLVQQQIQANPSYWLSLADDMRRVAEQGLRMAIRARVMAARGLQ